MLTTNYRLLARYNQWMNSRLYDCAATLTPAHLREDRGAFFKSVLGTLNHLAVADIIWLQRFAGHPANFAALTPVTRLDTPTALDAILHDELAPLHELRTRLDDCILAFGDELSDEKLLQAFAYSNMKGERFEHALSQPLLHFFNHQTHHRGQVTTLLNQFGIDVGVTDLLVTIRQWQQ